MASTDQQRFAERLRSLRLAAHLTIEQASELAGLTPGFWGEVERNVAEPCLGSLYAFAKAFKMTVPTLLTIDEGVGQPENRLKLVALIDLLTPQKAELAHKILQNISDYNPQNGN